MIAQAATSSLIAALGGALGIVGLLAAGYVVVRSSVQSETTKLWKEQAGALEARLGEVEARNERCETENAALRARLNTLESVVTAGPAIEALRRDLASQHVELLGAIAKAVT